MTNKDEQIQKLIEVVRTKKEAISKAQQKPNWLTNCAFRYQPESPTSGFNIQTVTDINVLVDALAFLIGKADAHEKATAKLGVVSDFKWLSYSIDKWENDFKTRIDKIQLKKNQDELESYESALNKLVSKEAREALELAELTKKILG